MLWKKVRLARPRWVSPVVTTVELIVEQRRSQIIDLRRAHGKDNPLLPDQHVLFKSQLTHPLRTRTFHETQVVGIVNDTAAVGVLVIHTDRPLKLCSRCSSSPRDAGFTDHNNTDKFPAAGMFLRDCVYIGNVTANVENNTVMQRINVAAPSLAVVGKQLQRPLAGAAGGFRPQCK